MTAESTSAGVAAQASMADSSECGEAESLKSASISVNGRDSQTLRDLPKIMSSETFNEQTLPPNSPFLPFLGTMGEARLEFVKSNKFKVYARLFAELFW